VDQKKQILVVEDEGVIGADIQSQLERMGYAVPGVVASGPEAIRLAREQRCDLVLMDIRLRGEMDGIETARELKNKLNVPVIYVTAYADWETVERAKLTGPHGYIMKPLREAEMRSAVEIALHRHEIESRLRASEAWLSGVLRNIGDAVMTANAQGDVEFLNPVAEELTGWQASDARGRPAAEVMPVLEEHTGRPAPHPVVRLLAGERIPVREEQGYLLLGRNGASTPVEVGCFENRDESQLRGVIVVFRDLTMRRGIEERLRQAERMETIGRLAGGLAHDFNNQLTVMLGCADQLCGRLNGREQVEAQEIKKAAELAAALTRQLLTMSRSEWVTPEPLDLNDLVREMQSTLSHSLGRSRTLVLDLAPGIGKITADRNQIKRVLVNLALNACDAMPRGGEMKIETAEITIAPDGSAAGPAAGKYIRLRVSDSGEGMSKETLAHVFEPFFTTKAKGVGTGLGLAVVHGIVSQHRGLIDVTSEANRGTAFTIQLPLTAASA